MKRVISILFLAVVFVSCSSDDDGSIDELNKNRFLWQSKNITDYKWNERISCFCAGPLERDVFVVNALKDKVEFDESGYSPEQLETIREYVFNSAHTIEEAFDLVEELLAKDVDALTLEYDEVYGFPTLISVDYDFQIADDEIAYSYSNFEIIN